MIFRQLFDNKSSTYTYIISSGKGREALIIDPVIENIKEYLNTLKELDLKLVKVIDTHIHADHITGLNELSKSTNCTKIMGEQSESEVIDVNSIFSILIFSLSFIRISITSEAECSPIIFMHFVILLNSFNPET